jgi:CHAD domain-containing protein
VTPPSTNPNDDRVLHLLKQRIRAVSKHLPKALAGDEEAVHQMRVAGRRLRGALPLLARNPKGKRVRRALSVLRALTRGAGRGRDLDVGVLLLEERLAAFEELSPGQVAVRRRLRDARRRSRGNMAEALLDIEIARLRRDLRAVVKRGAEDLFTVLSRLRDTRDALGDTILRELAATGDRFDPEALHRARRQARRLRYAAEVNDVIRGQASGATDLLKDLQERIGAIHDRHVLTRWLLEVTARAERLGQTDVAAEGSALAAWFEDASRAKHRALLARDPVEIVNEALQALGKARTAA